MGIDRSFSRWGVASEIEFLNNIFIWNQKVLTETVAKRDIEWKFNPPSALHHEIFWERLVRFLQQVMDSNIWNRKLDDEILTTIFCPFEQSLNSHPVVAASAGATDLDILTSNILLQRTIGPIYHWTWVEISTTENFTYLRKRTPTPSGIDGWKSISDSESPIQIVFSSRSTPRNRWFILVRRTYQSENTEPSGSRC